MHDSLHRNSILLMINGLVLSAFGFIFWAFAARFYSQSQVGITATLITASMLVLALGTFGFDKAFVRFLPRTKDVHPYVDTGFAVSILVSFVASIIYLIITYFFVPNLSFLHESIFWIIIFILFMVINMLNTLTNFPFIALRLTYLVVFINIGFGIFRLLALVILSSFKNYGLFYAHMMAITVALIITLILMNKYMGYRPRLKITKPAYNKMSKYAFESYISNLLSVGPSLILPTIIAANFATSEVAYYYIVAIIVAILYIVPQATAQSLFAEGSWDREGSPNHLYRSLKSAFIVLIPAVLVLTVGGKFILSIFGPSYPAKGYLLLLLLSIAGLFKAVNYSLGTIFRIHDNVRLIIGVNAVYAAIILIGCMWSFKHGYNINIVGWFTILAELFAATTYAFCYRKMVVVHV